MLKLIKGSDELAENLIARSLLIANGNDFKTFGATVERFANRLRSPYLLCGRIVGGVAGGTPTLFVGDPMDGETVTRAFGFTNEEEAVRQLILRS